MKTVAELQAAREKAREAQNGVRVIVGMATCGIAAGATPVLKALQDEVKNQHLDGVTVVQTGCIGMCQFEPIVEVLAPGKEKITYGKVTPEKVARIVTEHLVNGEPVAEFTIANLMK